MTSLEDFRTSIPEVDGRMVMGALVTIARFGRDDAALDDAVRQGRDLHYWWDEEERRFTFEDPEYHYGDDDEDYEGLAPMLTTVVRNGMRVVADTRERLRNGEASTILAVAALRNLDGSRVELPDPHGDDALAEDTATLYLDLVVAALSNPGTPVEWLVAHRRSQS